MPGFSRASYAEFVRNVKVQTLAACHERAFEAFGGVPKGVLYGLLQAGIRTDSSSHAVRTILTRKSSSAANSRSAAG
ncbi:transposase [Polaromonas glacialis]|uniref:transposase n=1 Tax=Polaromonas glacialis TaxID=866564 RepID=UPI000496047C